MFTMLRPQISVAGHGNPVDRMLIIEPVDLQGRQFDARPAVHTGFEVLAVEIEFAGRDIRFCAEHRPLMTSGDRRGELVGGRNNRRGIEQQPRKPVQIIEKRIELCIIQGKQIFPSRGQYPFADFIENRLTLPAWDLKGVTALLELTREGFQMRIREDHFPGRHQLELDQALIERAL